MQEYKGQGIVLQGDTNNNNLFKVRCVATQHPAPALVSDFFSCVKSHAQMCCLAAMT